jgi:hypothetical protein
MNLFQDFDFRALETPGYPEDSVKENIVNPILRQLGYGTSGPHQVMPAKAVSNPFVYLGASQHKVSILPDYLLRADDANAFTLGVTAPSVNIHRGEVAEQAFAYAIHPEIRTFYYGLCNGRELCVYKWTRVEPVLAIPVHRPGRPVGGTRRAPSARRPSPNRTVADFLPDFGLSYLKLGGDRNARIRFCAGRRQTWWPGWTKTPLPSPASSAGKTTRTWVRSTSPATCYEEFLSCVPAGAQDKVRTALSEEPYFIVFTKEDNFELIIHAGLSGGIRTNEDEQYYPLTGHRL